MSKNLRFGGRRLCDRAEEYCDHIIFIVRDDAIRCCQCQSRLVTLPTKDGEFRMEWLPSAPQAILPCAA